MDLILSKLKSGGSISKRERDYILSKLKYFDTNIELEQAIRAFGLSNKATNENVKLIEKFLDSKSDIVLSSTINVLCSTSYWGLAENYIEKIKVFTGRNHAFNLSETQIIIFSIYGEYLYKSSSIELFHFLNELFLTELEEYKIERDYFQKARLERIYHCLDVGVRGRKAILEYRVGRMKLPDDIDNNLLMHVAKLIQ